MRFFARLADVVFEHLEFGAHFRFGFFARDLQFGFALQLVGLLLRTQLSFAICLGFGRGARCGFRFHARFGCGERARCFFRLGERLLARDFSRTRKCRGFGFYFPLDLPDEACFGGIARGNFGLRARFGFRFGGGGGFRHRFCLYDGGFGGLGARFRFRPRLGFDFGASFSFCFCTRTCFGFGLGAFFSLFQRLFHGAHLCFERDARACFRLRAGAGFGFRLRAGFGFDARGGFGVGLGLRFYIGFRFRSGTRFGFSVGRRFGRHGCAHARFGFGFGLVAGRGVDFTLRLGAVLGGCARLLFGFQLGSGFLAGIGFGSGTGARFDFLARLGLGGGAGCGFRACLGFSLGPGALFGFGIQQSDFGGRSEVEIEVVVAGCITSGGCLRKNGDVTFGEQFFQGGWNFRFGEAGFFRQVRDLGFAVDGKKHQPELARQTERLVLDLQYSLGGLRVYRLWMH